MTKEEYEDQLGLALNTQILWNTRYSLRVRDAYRAVGGEAPPKTPRGSPR